MDLVLSRVCFTLSGVPISDLGAPARTPIPTPVRATSARAPGTILPCLVKPSIASDVRIATSKAAPASIFSLNVAVELNSTESGWPMTRSIWGRTSSTTALIPLEHSIRISPDLASFPAANKTAHPKLKAAIAVVAWRIFMVILSVRFSVVQTVRRFMRPSDSEAQKSRGGLGGGADRRRNGGGAGNRLDCVADPGAAGGAHPAGPAHRWNSDLGAHGGAGPRAGHPALDAFGPRAGGFDDRWRGRSRARHAEFDQGTGRCAAA